MKNKILEIKSLNELHLFSKKQLRKLLKETSAIRKSRTPFFEKQSAMLKQLFELENCDIYSWTDKFNKVQILIEIEILRRVKNDAW
jgi:hypothetical protein